MGNCCFTFFHRPNFFAFEGRFSFFEEERQRERNVHDLLSRSIVENKISKISKVSFCGVGWNFFLFFISLLEEEHNEISRNKSVCGTEHEILFILILLFFTVAVPPRPRNAGFQPPFPAETRFPDRESACESVTTEPRWNANDEKKYR